MYIPSNLKTYFKNDSFQFAMLHFEVENNKQIAFLSNIFSYLSANNTPL